MSAETDPPLPWYRFFWPWFIVLLLSTVVVAGIATVVIAFQMQDSLVRDDWYDDGVAINRRFEDEAEARRLGIGGRLSIDTATGEVWLDLEGQGVAELERVQLELSHPTQSQRDRLIALRRTPNGRFRADLERALSGRWYAQLRPADGGEEGAARWRISRTLSLPSAQPIPIGGGG